MTTHNGSDAPSSPPLGGASISGTIEFRDVREPTRNVTVHVRVQDTSRADASASTVTEQVLRGVHIFPGMPPVRFSVHGIPQNSRARYAVRVHADVDGNGIVSPGDYVSTQSYPVPTGVSPQIVTIAVRRVG
jgi:uncharacterized lipoprotein YbaY